MWQNPSELLPLPVLWPETTEITFNLTAQQPLAPWIPLFLQLPSLGHYSGYWILCIFPIQIFLQCSLPQQSSAFWQGPSASLTFYLDSLTCKINVSAVPALMDAEISKGEPILCPWPQISDNDHKCECSESCKLNTMPRAHLVLLWHCKNWREAQKRHQSSAPNEAKLTSYGAISTWAIKKAWEERIMSLLKRSTQQNNKAARFKTKKSPKTPTAQVFR